MANPTTNYGWPMPTSTDLVTDLPADFAAFGQPVDTSLKALNPETTLGDIAYRSSTSNTNTRLGIGTSGQVLAVSGGGVPAWTTTADVTPLTTKGDLFTFTTVDARIGVGANNTVLTADSAEATGLKWATPASGGKVLQVLNNTNSSQTGSTSATYADTGLTLTITPSSATSKILIFANCCITGQIAAAGAGFKVLRAGTDIITFSLSIPASSAGSSVGMASTSYLDSPSTTSATIYKVQFNTGNTNQVYFNGGSPTSTLTLMEIGA